LNLNHKKETLLHFPIHSKNMIIQENATKILQNMDTVGDTTVYDISMQKPVMLVFLRHFGCVFCKEALTDIANQRAKIEADGVEIVFVHMSDTATAKRYFNRYELDGIDFVNDEACNFYKAFGLLKGNFSQLFGLSTWIRGFNASSREGHKLEYSRQLGDSFQMPGIFMITKGQITKQFIHKMASERPDYLDLLDGCEVAFGNNERSATA